MNSQPTPESEMTGFHRNSRPAVCCPEGTQTAQMSLYDKQGLTWLISEARKNATQVPNCERALQVLTTVNIC